MKNAFSPKREKYSQPGMRCGIIKIVMDRKLIKAICIIAVFAAVTVMVIGSIATAKGTSYLVEEIDEKIVATAESFANDLSAEFQSPGRPYRFARFVF